MTMLPPGLLENGRADYEDAWEDFLFPQEGNMCHQMVNNDAVQQEKEFNISTPGMSPSVLLEEVTESDRENGICCVTPFQRLIKMVSEMSPKALSASVSDMGSLVCMNDKVSSSVPLNKSKAAVGGDLGGTVASRLRRKYSRCGGTVGSRRTRNCRSARMFASSRRLMDCEGFDLNSVFTQTSRIETPEHLHWHGFSLSVEQEIRRINEQLIDTVVSICDKDMITTAIDNGEGIIVECSFVAMHSHSNLISKETSALQFAVHPLKFLVPKGYPHISPIFKKFHVEACPAGCEDLSFKAREKFNISVRSLPHPFSISQIARTWDVCAREVVSEYAQRHGGGSFSSKYGSWEDCRLNAAAWS